MAYDPSYESKQFKMQYGVKANYDSVNGHVPALDVVLPIHIKRNIREEIWLNKLSERQKSIAGSQKPDLMQ